MASNHSIEQRTIPGGYLLCELQPLLAAWAAYRRKQLSFLDLRIYLAMHEVVHRRRAGASAQTWHERRSVRVVENAAIEELLILTRCMRRSRVTGAVARLERLGFIERDGGNVGLPAAGIVLPRELGALAQRMVQQLAPRSFLPFPRRLLRYLAGNASAAALAVVIAQLARCVYVQENESFSTLGSCSVERIARAFELHPRTVKAMRHALLMSGWLTRCAAELWHEQRYGARFAVNLSWPPASPERPPPAAQPSRRFAPPQGTGPLADSGNQQPVGRPLGAKLGQRQQRSARLRHLVPDDLRSPLRLNELHAQAVDAGWITMSEADQLRFFASARHACRVGTRNPGGLFVATVRGNRWHLLTLTEEEWARRALRRVDAGAPTPDKIADQPNMLLTELVTLVAGSLSLSKSSERAKVRTADAVPKKNWAVSEHPAVSSSTAITSNASISDSTLSASAA